MTAEQLALELRGIHPIVPPECCIEIEYAATREIHTVTIRGGLL